MTCLVVGLTGGMGAGKTTVANLFAAHGTPIIDADVIARELTQPDAPAFPAIVAHFGKQVLLDEHHLNRRKLRDIIFHNTEERRWLEQLLHPLIETAMEKQIKKVTAPYCIAVIPLLFEVKPYPFLDRILVVDAPEPLQLARVTARDKTDKAQVDAILNTQVRRENRLTQAQDVIVNDGTIEALIPQVEKLHQLYMRLSRK